MLTSNSFIRWLGPAGRLYEYSFSWIGPDWSKGSSKDILQRLMGSGARVKTTLTHAVKNANKKYDRKHPRGAEFCFLKRFQGRIKGSTQGVSFSIILIILICLSYLAVSNPWPWFTRKYCTLEDKWKVQDCPINSAHICSAIGFQLVYTLFTTL